LLAVCYHKQRMFKKLVGFLILTFSAFFLFPSPVRAEDAFETSYEVEYEVQPDGSCKVDQAITLINKTRGFYASEYRLNLGSSKISQVRAWDSGGDLATEVTNEGGDTVIRTHFSRPAAGKGQKITWHLSYYSGVSRRWGKILRVDIPGFKEDSTISSYRVRLKVPNYFGKMAFASPMPDRVRNGDRFRVLEFSNRQGIKGGIRVGFGRTQFFDFKIKYQLKNPESTRAYLEVALPPDILKRQKVILTGISPAPETVRADEDGNYLARFTLSPKEERVVTVTGKVAIFAVDLPSDRGGRLKDLPRKLVERYTVGDTFWEVDDEEVQRRAQALTDPDKSVFANARSIYEYVVAHLSYDKGRLERSSKRFGAAKALRERKHALCTEYADLFVALARAAGIPARVLEGYAYTEDLKLRPTMKDVLHAWAEFYLPGFGWWQVDPTWGSTTGGSDYFSSFDLSHIVFAVKGIDSETPYPAGSYRLGENQEGLINVNFGSGEFPTADPDLKLVGDFPERSLSGWPTRVHLKLQNAGETGAFSAVLKFRVEGAKLWGKTLISMGSFPPLAQKNLNFKLSASPFRHSRARVVITVEYRDAQGEKHRRELTREINFQPFWIYLSSWQILLPLLGGLTFSAVGISLFFKKIA